MNGKKHMPDYLFDKINDIKGKIKKSDNILLFLDYDGTLVTFKDKPADVVTTYEVESIISQIIGLKEFKVAIITGRTLSDIKKLIDIEGLSYAALHGLQIEMSDGSKYDIKAKEELQLILKEVKNLAKQRFQNEKGVLLEDKLYTFALHYRMVEDNRENNIKMDFIKIIKSVDTNNKLDILPGSKLIEIRPKGWNKGKAVDLLTSHIKSDSVLPIYIGDDTTDEDAFNVLKDMGITIYVSNNSNLKTAAKYWLKDPDDVLKFLDILSNKDF
jgi:trehalose 6-phosphate phosphatase